MIRKEIFIRCVVCGGTKSQEEMTRKNGHEWKCNKGICKKCTKQHREDVKIVSPNKVYCGDNLEIMKKICDESVDLIYLDPPYFKQQNFEDFNDKWDSLNDYLIFMVDRLKECYRILKPTGSIYLHVDYSAVHYLKVKMDKIFGYNNFRNHIIWHYITAPESKSFYGRKHDDILFYSKSKDMVFNLQRVPHSENTKSKRIYKQNNKEYVCNTNPEGKAMDDVWDIPIISASSKERLKYSTQKPIKLLERIIKTSSNKNDIILDPFCGSGSTLEAAKILDRNYIGIDQNKQAIKMCNKRLKNVYRQKTVDNY